MKKCIVCPIKYNEEKDLTYCPVCERTWKYNPESNIFEEFQKDLNIDKRKEVYKDE